MKPDAAMVVTTKMAESLGVGHSTSTTNTLTPTTLRCITQLFESDNCVESIKSLDSEGSAGGSFVPPPVVTAVSTDRTYTNLESKSGWAGGTTTIVTPSREIPHIAVLMPDSVDAAETLKREQEEQKSKADIIAKSQQVTEDNNNNNNSSRPRRSARRTARAMSTPPSSPSPPSSPEFVPTTTSSRGTKRTVARKSKAGNVDGAKRRRGDESLSQEEFEKISVRRMRNKEAAARCRKRRVDLTNTLMEQVQEHEVAKRALEEEIQQLKGQKEELEFILQAHAAHCRLQVPLQQQQQQQQLVVAVKSEPLPPNNVLVEAADAPYAVPEPVTSSSSAPRRPASLPLPAVPASNSDIIISTPSSVVAGLSLDSVTTGLTPMGPPAVASITTPTIAMLTTPTVAASEFVVL